MRYLEQEDIANHQRIIIRRLDSQPPVNMHASYSSLTGEVSPPSLPTVNCRTCMRPLETRSSMPEPYTLPPQQRPTINCPICMGPVDGPKATKCGHLFCEECIRTAISAQPKCPVCRCRATMKELIRIYLPS